MNLYDGLIWNAIGGGSGGGGGGGSSSGDADVIFYDYDGTILYTYTKADFLALDAMPENPVHEGLTSQGWNWTLADAKTHVTSYKCLDVGQLYMPTDEKTHVFITIENNPPSSESAFTIRLGSSSIGSATIDWGDGTSEATTATAMTAYSHQYASSGNYEIKIDAGTGTVNMSGDNSKAVYGNHALTNANIAFYNASRYRSCNIGKNVTLGGNYFRGCNKLETISFPSSVTITTDYLFNDCRSLRHVTLPQGVTSIGQYFVGGCKALLSCSLPKSIGNVGGYSFQYCTMLGRLVFPDNATSSGNSHFNRAMSLKTVCFPPTFNAGAYAMFQESGIEEITLYSSTNLIDRYCFSGCYNLKKVTVLGDISVADSSSFNSTSLLEMNGFEKIKKWNNFPQGALAINSFTISEDVTSLPGGTFQNWYNVRYITIPASVTSIGGSFCNGCLSLVELHMKPTSPPTLSGNPFYYTRTDFVIYVPQGSLSDYQSANYWKSFASHMQEEPA